ncbi:Aldehyde/histidinol dehydrogenase [Suillus lakei]|nr:Aldehyde/histidinol dehydrogenase [Suillus lakei]
MINRTGRRHRNTAIVPVNCSNVRKIPIFVNAEMHIKAPAAAYGCMIAGSHAAGSAERNGLKAAPAQMQHIFHLSFPVRTGRLAKQPIPSDYARYLCTYHEADEATVASAAEWEAMPWNYRATTFLRAAELVSGKCRLLCLYRALEVFVLAVSTFNFTAIGGNLPGAIALVGNTVILAEGRRPIQIVPEPPPEVFAPVISHLSFRALHITGITSAFKKLMERYCHIPRRDKVVLRCRGYVSSSLWSSGFNDLLLSEVVKIKVGPPSDFSSSMGAMIGRPAYDKITGFIQKAKDTGERFLPTIILIKGHESFTMKEETFGAVITVHGTLELIDNTSPYALTGSILAADRKALLTATNYENFLGLEGFQYPSNLI